MFFETNNVSLGMAIAGLVLCQLGLPLPETLFLVAAGVAAERGRVTLWHLIPLTCAAVLVGDLLLYGLSRAFGPSAFRHRPLRWLLPPRVYPRVDSLFERHGAAAVFVARFISGLRGAVFVVAATRGMPLRQFLLGDGLAILVSVPAFPILGFFGARNLALLRARLDQANLLVLMVALLALLGYVAWQVVQRRRAGRL